ncbi:GAF domain-containing sensor histidine kinase [Solirubrobacter soli]|uniref:GAF domain-containing sensor histidine kinase n=1 Tax=Solirubrobacter soli TaxID=363832 RepID=UPI0012FAEF08|nr:ATP-binding protein [Solirubrobacter soli]
MSTGADSLEAERLEALRALQILDTPPEERFDRISRIAAAMFAAPTVLVSLMDAERQWHKACVGAFEAETDRALTFCTITIQRPEPLVIEDTLLDERFATHPMVTGEPHIRFYAGHPLSTVDGYRVGTICLVDYGPREFGPDQVALLHDLARIAEDELNHRELSQALAAWRGSEQRFQAVFRDAGIGMTLIDRNGRCVEANAAFSRMVGIPADELRGLSIGAVTHPDDREGDRESVEQLFSGQRELYRREKRYVRPDGTVIWGALTAALLRDADGRPELGIGMIEDITERKEVERIKDELLSVVGHELRTPLTSIRGSLGLLEAGVAGELPQEAREMVGIARDNTDRLVRLVNDTLDLERLQAGRVDIEPRPVTPATLLATTARVVQPVADAADVELGWEADELELMADADRIVQALVNLVANAVKFSPAGTCVRTSITRLGDRALVSVADKGRGIPPEQLETIFERFRQVDASDAREKGGTGLGLSIARAIVEQHAGRIWAESTPGEGSTFFFTLPFHRPAATIAVYDRRGAPREELARAVRRHGARVVSFDAPEKLIAAQESFVAVVVSHAGGLDELEPGVPILSLLPGEDMDKRIVELLKEVGG